jgi:cyanophycinase-like exopeptidase
LTPNPFIKLNFNKQTAANRIRVYSLQKAKLIFISGGDQAQFMGIVHNILKSYYPKGVYW